MSKIEWTDETWNPIRGCSRVSAGCENCYAERMAIRMSGPGGAYEGVVIPTKKGPRWTGKITVNWKASDAPYKWKSPRMVFVNSMSDLFHPNVDRTAFKAIMETMMYTESHTYQILTKRPERIEWCMERSNLVNGFPSHMWIGTSVESNDVKNRIAHLITVNAKVRFLSVEPMLGPVDIDDYLDTGRIHWVIIGGESGPKARFCDIDWKLSLIESCERHNVPVFVKQLGSHWGMKFHTIKPDGDWDKTFKGNDISKWPAPLQKREFPITQVA